MKLSVSAIAFVLFTAPVSLLFLIHNVEFCLVALLMGLCGRWM